MGKTGRWLRSILTGKKEKEKEEEEEKEKFDNQQQPFSWPAAAKEKRRWSFRRPPAAAADAAARGIAESENEQRRHAMAAAAAAAATAAAADAAVAAAQAAAAVIRLTAAAAAAAARTRRSSSAVEAAAAAVKIQSAFRAYLARKALCALRGLVKLQALVRGHLVRKQAAAALRSMEALAAVQSRARAQRIRTLEHERFSPRIQPSYRRYPIHPRHRPSLDMDRNAEENIKIVEMDRVGSKSRNSYSMENKLSGYGHQRRASKSDIHPQISPTPSALTDISTRTYSGHFEEFSFNTARTSPYYSVNTDHDAAKSCIATCNEGNSAFSYENQLYPNYMTNTESSRAKARSQSAPKQRPDLSERPPSRRRVSIEGRGIPRGGKMQRSSSHLGSSTNNLFQYPWLIKLDKSNMSIKNSKSGSTSTVLANTTCCRSHVAADLE